MDVSLLLQRRFALQILSEIELESPGCDCGAIKHKGVYGVFIERESKQPRADVSPRSADLLR